MNWKFWEWFGGECNNHHFGEEEATDDFRTITKTIGYNGHGKKYFYGHDFAVNREIGENIEWVCIEQQYMKTCQHEGCVEFTSDYKRVGCVPKEEFLEGLEKDITNVDPEEYGISGSLEGHDVSTGECPHCNSGFNDQKRK